MKDINREQLEKFLAAQDDMLIAFQVLSKAMVATATAIKDFYILMEKTGMLDDPSNEE